MDYGREPRRSFGESFANSCLGLGKVAAGAVVAAAGCLFGTVVALTGIGAPLGAIIAGYAVAYGGKQIGTGLKHAFYDPCKDIHRWRMDRKPPGTKQVAATVELQALRKKSESQVSSAMQSQQPLSPQSTPSVTPTTPQSRRLTV